ncbi:hypothetical protein BH10BAC6_BH10BAC6_17620 [soil metagenome]
MSILSRQGWAGDNEGAKICLVGGLTLTQRYAIRDEEAAVHKRLRDHCRAMGDFDSYVGHNERFMAITEEIRGGATQRKLATQQRQAELEKERNETEKHKAALYSTLPKHIADRVVRGEVVNDHIDAASVMFLDIVGFTTISSKIPAGHVVHLLDSIFSECDRICALHDVTKIKTIGDSYMAVAGLQPSDEHHTTNASSAALEILQALDDLEIKMPPDLGDTDWVKDVGEIKVRIGLHCGPVVAGVLGKERMQYDVWGDTVNIASRMESTSEPGRIQVSEAFASNLRRPHSDGGPSVDTSIMSTLVHRGAVDIKGKGQMQTYWLEHT